MAFDACHIFRILGVAEDAPFEEVKKAYRKAALRLHPDKNPDNVEAATKQFQALLAGYRLLEERAQQDVLRESRGKESCGCPGCAKSFRKNARRGEDGQGTPRQEREKQEKKQNRREAPRREKEKEGSWGEAPWRGKSKARTWWEALQRQQERKERTRFWWEAPR